MVFLLSHQLIFPVLFVDLSISARVLQRRQWHSSTLAWKIPWMKEPGRLQSMGSRRVEHDWVTSLSIFTSHFHALEKEMATHSSVLAWRNPGTGEPAGLPSMGSHRVGHDWSNLAAAAARVLKTESLDLYSCVDSHFLGDVILSCSFKYHPHSYASHLYISRQNICLEL